MDAQIEENKSRVLADICHDPALDTTKKWNLKYSLGEKLKAI